MDTDVNNTFNCPHCGQHLAAEPDMAGMTIDCPVCGKPIIVPEAPQQGMSGKKENANDHFSFTCPHCGQSLAAEVGMSGMECECPGCGESIVVPDPATKDKPKDWHRNWKGRWSHLSSKQKRLALVAVGLIVFCVLIGGTRMASDKETGVGRASDTESAPEEYLEWTYEVLGNEASVGGGSTELPAIPRDTYGAITIPAKLGGLPVTRINAYAFSGCSGLTSVTIPDSVRSIGEHAFAHCSGLTSVTIPSSVTNIGTWAFSYCKSLTWIRIPRSVRKIEDWTFDYCSNLKTVYLPPSTSIDKYAFDGCAGVRVVIETTNEEREIIAKFGAALNEMGLMFDLINSAEAERQIREYQRRDAQRQAAERYAANPPGSNLGLDERPMQGDYAERSRMQRQLQEQQRQTEAQQRREEWERITQQQEQKRKERTRQFCPFCRGSGREPSMPNVPCQHCNGTRFAPQY